MNKNQRDSNGYNLVNQILAEWNPINVPEVIAESEYTNYVSNVLQFRNDLEGLVKELERIITEIMGLVYDRTNPEHRQHTLTFANKIIQSLNDNQLISYSKLSEAIDTDTSDNRVKENAEFLVSAITDFPTFNLKELINFLNTLKNEIGFPLTYELKYNYEKRLIFDNGENVWKKEALSSVLKMFYWDKSRTLEEMIEEISKHYKIRNTIWWRERGCL